MWGGAYEKPCYFLVQGGRAAEAVDSRHIKKSMRDDETGLQPIITTRGHHRFGLPCDQHCGDRFAYFISLILPQLHQVDALTSPVFAQEEAESWLQ